MTSKYWFTPPGCNPEEVERERWRWRATYLDGTVLMQFEDSDSSFHQFREIDQPRLLTFTMEHDDLPPIVLLFPENAKLVHKYIKGCLDYRGPNEWYYNIYLIGYQLGPVRNFLMIMPDDTVIMTDDPDKVQISVENKPPETPT